MRLNCRPGDLAVIVRAVGDAEPLLGKIVRVTTPAAGLRYPAWNYEAPLLMVQGYQTVLTIADAILRPLRDSDGEDETLRWAGRPAILYRVRGYNSDAIARIREFLRTPPDGRAPF